MTTRIGLTLFGLWLLIFAGAWASWKEAPPHDDWTLEDPVRIIADFAPQEKLVVPYRLRNTADVPRRILGAYFC